MSKVAGAIVVTAALVMTSAVGSAKAEAKGRRHHYATRIDVVDWRGSAPVSPCAVEIYPYAPSLCLPRGYIVFDDKAYFAPRYGYRAQRYYDGW